MCLCTHDGGSVKIFQTYKNNQASKNHWKTFKVFREKNKLWMKLISCLTHFVWTFVSQMMSTWSRLSPSAPRYCICQHASWSTHFPSGSCDDSDASIGIDTSAFSMNFHRRYSARLMIWPLPLLYMNTPNWSRIKSSTACCPPTLQASIKSPPTEKENCGKHIIMLERNAELNKTEHNSICAHFSLSLEAQELSLNGPSCD